ncbi:MAG: glycosyltransferase, partial [Dysgonomonas sp.]
TSVIPILMNDPELDIFCVGSEFTEDEKYFFRALDIENRIKQSFVADEDLYAVYNRAEMFVYPSYYEGFGIPILEAFQAKCPVVLAYASCFSEVAGDAALYFQPKSPDQLRNNIMSLLNDPMLRGEYIAKGSERLLHYSWKKSALDTVSVYKKIVETRR